MNIINILMRIVMGGRLWRPYDCHGLGVYDIWLLYGWVIIGSGRWLLQHPCKDDEPPGRNLCEDLVIIVINIMP